MFNLFSKKEEPKSVPFLEEEPWVTQNIRMNKFIEKRKKEAELYNKIIKNDEYLALALKMMIHRIDIATGDSLREKIGTLESRIEKKFSKLDD